MRAGFAISCTGHAAVLLWSVLTLVVRPYHAETTQALPIDVISTTEFAQMTNGAKNAPQAEKPKPVAEKVAEAKPVDDPVAKLANKEIKAATDVPPVPEPKPPEPKVKRPQPPTPADPIAEALKKDDEKKPEPKKPDVKPPTPPKKPAQQEAPAFDPRKVEALLDKRTPQRVASAGNEVNNTATLGLPNGSAGQLSQTELMAMRARLQDLWNPPTGSKDPQELTLEIEIQLKPDGTLAAAPIVLTGGNSPLFLAAKDSAVRAVYRGQPYSMLRPEHYDLWKDIVVTFDPRFMFGN
jgi:outer membrane biosynthesis protein TonB